MANAGGTFASLKVRNFRIYFLSQLISLSGTWMQTVARAWLVLELTDKSGFAVGMVVALESLPMLLFGAWGGVLADRFNKVRILYVTTSLMGTLALILALLTFAEVVQVWHIYLLALLFGCVNLVALPTRQSIVSEMVQGEQLTNAVGLNSAMVHSARIVGPAVGGVLIVTVGTAWCFAINAASAVLVILGTMRLDKATMYPSKPVARSKGQVREAFSYVRANRSLRDGLIYTGTVMAFVNSNQVILPVLAKVTFEGTATTYSTMTVFTAIGAICGALTSAKRGRPSDEAMLVAGIGYGCAMLLAAASPFLWLVLPVLALGGGFGIAFATTSISKTQLESEPHMRGRVLSLRLMTVVGTGPLGSPMVGAISSATSARWALCLSGLVPLAGSFWYARAQLGHRLPGRFRQPLVPAAVPATAAEEGAGLPG